MRDKIKLLILSKYDRMGASSRLRTHQYIPWLDEAGFDVDVQCLFSEEYLRRLYGQGKKPLWILLIDYVRRLLFLFRVRNYDLIWIEKEIFPWLPSWFERVLKIFGTPYVVDFDDAIFHNYDRNRRSVVRSILGTKIPNVLRYAAGVTMGNKYLVKYAGNNGAKLVHLIPTVIDLDRYQVRTPGKGDRSVVIGWMGSPSSFKYLAEMESLFASLEKEFSVEFLFVGTGPSRLGLKNATYREWTEESEVSELQNMDIGLMPLLDTPWEQGKCGYKLIQYMAVGKPVVASAIGANCDIVVNEKSGYLVNTPQEWHEALCSLIDDAVLREEMGRHGRKLVEEKYCVQAVSSKVVSALNEALPSQS